MAAPSRWHSHLIVGRGSTLARTEAPDGKYAGCHNGGCPKRIAGVRVDVAFTATHVADRIGQTVGIEKHCEPYGDPSEDNDPEDREAPEPSRTRGRRRRHGQSAPEA